MAKQTVHNHTRFYDKRENKTALSRSSIATGQIITFSYPTAPTDRRPLIFVMETNYRKMERNRNKSISGINLNYLSTQQLNNFFIKVLAKAPWRDDRVSKFQRIDLHDEGTSGGISPSIIYEQIIKKTILPRANCWRKYKLNKMGGSIQQIDFQFNRPPLKKIFEDETKTDIGKISEADANTLAEKALKDKK